MGYDSPLHGLDGNGDPVGEAERIEAIEATRLDEKTAGLTDDEPTGEIPVPIDPELARQRAGGDKAIAALEESSRWVPKLDDDRASLDRHMDPKPAGHNPAPYDPRMPGRPGFLAEAKRALLGDQRKLAEDTERVGLGFGDPRRAEKPAPSDHNPPGVTGLDASATERTPLDEALEELPKLIKASEQAHRKANLDRRAAMAALDAARASAIRVRIFLVDPERFMIVVDGLGAGGEQAAEGFIDDLTQIAEDTRGCVGIACHTGLVALEDFEERK